MSTYKASVPSDNSVDPRILKFYENFYAVSDNPAESAHEEYARSMTDDGTLVMGTRSATGYDDVLALRKGLWSGPVKTRKHTVNKIYPFGANGNEVMLNGSVDYGLKNGKDLTVEWAAKGTFVEDAGKLRMKHYQVYLDSAPVANAMKD